jgi:molybdopterin synthase catalytic subunit
VTATKSPFCRPSAGASGLKYIRLIATTFAPGDEVARFCAAHPESGGVASFTGQVRAGGGVEALELTHYEPLTRAGMEDLANRALGRWVLDGVLVIHRTGLMAPAEPIVLVAAAARHRRDAFCAADFLMDHLKSEAWFWKREKTVEGWRWIEPRNSDYRDLSRWE